MEYPLLSTIIASIVSAFILGMVAKKLGLPAILGYIMAGIVIGPYTPGFVGDTSFAKELAEIGVILLMFGVGLHFSVQDLLESRKISLPGSITQILSATIIGALLTIFMGYDTVPAIIFGFSLSVASRP